MICKVCGAPNDDQLTQCRICAALLVPNESLDSDEPVIQEGPRSEAVPKFRGFVPSPKWPTPDLSIDADFSDMDYLPEANSSDARNTVAASFNDQLKQAPTFSNYNTSNDTPSYNKVSKNYIQADKESIQSEEPWDIYQEDLDEDQQDSYDVYAAEKSNTFSYRNKNSMFHSERPRKKSARKHNSGKSRYRRKVNLLPFIIAGIVIVLLVIGGIIIDIQHGGLDYFFSSALGGSPILKAAEIKEGVNQKGNPAFIIDLYVKGGNEIELTFPTSTQKVDVGPSNYLQLIIEKELLIPDEPISEAIISVVPDICVVTPDGERYPLELDALNIDVPQVILSVTEPSTASFVSANGLVFIAGRVADPASAVFVNDQEFPVDAEGNFSGNYTLTERGTHIIKIEAHKNRHQSAVHTFSVDYTQTEIVIGINDKASLRTSDGNGTVTGTMDPGASISVSGDAVDGSATYDAAAGTFSFKYSLSAGTHSDITLKADRSGVFTEKILTVEHAPDYESYTKKCYQMDYDRMTSETKHTAAYKCIGTLVDVTDMGEYYIGRLATSSGDIMFEYHGSAVKIDASDTRKFNLWADYEGIDEATGLPKVYVWFITF